MTERPFIVPNFEQPEPTGREVVDWQCPRCKFAVLMPVWIAPKRVDGVLKGGVHTWACAPCMSTGKITPVVGPGYEPPEMPVDSNDDLDD